MFCWFFSVSERNLFCFEFRKIELWATSYSTNLDFSSTVCFFEVRFLAALASWLCWLHRFGLFLADKLGKKFGQQFFSGPRYIVNFQLPAVG
jgi:hypothetical protein